MNRCFFRPFGGLIDSWLSTHGLRRGLHSFAASRLDRSSSPEASKNIRPQEKTRPYRGAKTDAAPKRANLQHQLACTIFERRVGAHPTFSRIRRTRVLGSPVIPEISTKTPYGAGSPIDFLRKLCSGSAVGRLDSAADVEIRPASAFRSCSEQVGEADRFNTETPSGHSMP